MIRESNKWFLSWSREQQKLKWQFRREVAISAMLLCAVLLVHFL